MWYGGGGDEVREGDIGSVGGGGCRDDSGGGEEVDEGSVGNDEGAGGGAGGSGIGDINLEQSLTQSYRVLVHAK